MRYNIKKIAELAGVSPATVSLAVNNKPGISPVTREKILNILESLNNKRTERKDFGRTITGSVRFLKIVKHGHIVNRDHDLFIASYIDGIEQEAHSNGYRLEINNIDAADIPSFVVHLKNTRIKGLIVLGTELPETDLEVFESLRIPVVIIDTTYDFLKLDFVDMNNEEAVYEIIRYFRDRGHRTIGLIRSDVAARNFELRTSIFPKALRHNDLPFDQNFTFTIDSTFNGAYEDMLQHLKRGRTPPTAIFSSNDLMASACIKAFKKRGIRVPDDVSIIGFDNLPICEILDPPLTTMNVSKKQIGQWAMKLIIDRAKNPDRPFIKCSVGGTLIRRESVRTLSRNPLLASRDTP